MTGPWGSCDRPCGGGYRTRSVTCQVSGVVVGGLYCDATAPTFYDFCNTGPCNSTYYLAIPWQYQGLDCPSQCSPGYLVRPDANCMQSGSLTVQSASFFDCSALTDPGSLLTCNNAVSCGFITGPWGPCIGGLQYRDIKCLNNNGDDVYLSSCPNQNSIPAASIPCINVSCTNGLWDGTETGIDCGGSCLVQCGGPTYTISPPISPSDKVPVYVVVFSSYRADLQSTTLAAAILPLCTCAAAVHILNIETAMFKLKNHFKKSPFFFNLCYKVSVNGSGTIFYIGITPALPDCNVTFRFPANVTFGANGAGNAASALFTTVYTTTPPAYSVSPLLATTNKPPVFLVTFNQAVTGLNNSLVFFFRAT